MCVRVAKAFDSGVFEDNVATYNILGDGIHANPCQNDLGMDE